MEARVVAALKRYLTAGQPGMAAPDAVVVDAHPAYVASRYRAALEPMARLEIGSVRADLICSSGQAAARVVTGYEVKPSSGDWRQGLGQARSYRGGVHHAWLAIEGDATALARDATDQARELGVGLLVLGRDGTWRELVRPVEPMPRPSLLGSSLSVLEGVPIARRLQLNHPLNYLAVAFVALMAPQGAALMQEMARSWPSLGSDGTRRHAISGAASIGLIDAEGALTLKGRTAAELMQALGFDPGAPPPSRARLCDAAPGLGAVARFVLLHNPAVDLVMRALARLPGPAPLPRLALAAAELDPALAAALFLADPAAELRPDLPGAAWNPSTVFKLKQVMWHAGLVATKSHASAGGAGGNYDPADDRWQSESRNAGRGRSL